VIVSETLPAKASTSQIVAGRQAKRMGACQRGILETLSTCKLASLRGDSRSETAALVRAARLLSARGQVVIVRLWNDQQTAVRHFAALPGAQTKTGEPIESLSVKRNVARVAGVTRATFAGSIRHLAREESVSPTTIWRDFRKVRKSADGGDA
jgi:hypothetical protein